MIARGAERDAAIAAMLPHVARDGWTRRSLTAGLVADADRLFPGGARDMVEAFCDLADRQMDAAAAERGLSALKLPARVRALIALRLEQNRPHTEAIRRAVALLTLPQYGLLAARCTARTVEAIWHAAGDQSVHFTWYSKRAILTGVYTSTLLFWLRDTSPDDSATLAFLDRRLAGVGRTTTMRRKVQQKLCGQRAA